MRHGLACLALLAGAALPGRAAETALAPAPPVAMRVARAFDGSAWRGPVTVVVREGHVASVSDAPPPPAMALVEIPGAVLTPGFVDLDAFLGLGTDRDEPEEALSPDLLVGDSFAPEPEEADAFRRSGVTVAWLASGTSGVLAGAGALVQPDAAGRRPAILRRAWGACGSLAAAARLPNRAPTSLPEQVATLRDGLARLPETIEARDRVRVRFDDAASARHAIAARAILVGQPESGPDLLEISAARDVIVSGLGPWSSRAQVEAVPQLARAGVRLGFGSAEAPRGPLSIRFAAARAVASGLPPEQALAALTGDAAAIAALPDGRGTLRPGAAADLVLWSGDPLSLASRPLRTWVAGVEVLRAD